MQPSASYSERDTQKHLLGCWALAVLGAMPFAIQPFFLGALGSEFSLKPDQLGLLAAADILGIVIASFSGVWWAKRFAFTRLVKIAAITMTMGYLALIFADNFLEVFWIRVVSGLLGHGIAFSLGTAFLCRTRYPDRAIAISVITQISFSAALLWFLPKILAATDIPTVLFCLSVVILCVLPLILLIEPSATPRSTSGKAHSSALLGWLLIALVCYQLGLSAIWAFIEAIGSARLFSLEETGLMLAIILPLSMTGSLLAGTLNLRWGRTLPVVLATVAATASLLALVQSQAPIFFALAFLMHQIAWNFGIGYVYGAVAEISDGSGAEILAPGSQSVGTALGPILAGILAVNLSMDAVIWVSISGMIVGSTILFFTRAAHSPRS